jgi:hypothetical protein
LEGKEELVTLGFSEMYVPTSSQAIVKHMTGFNMAENTLLEIIPILSLQCN